MKLSPRAAAGAVVVLAAVLTACGGPDVRSGEVVGKNYEEPYTWYSSQCAMYDSKMACQIWQQVPHDEPEQYQITLENCDIRDDGKCARQTHNVSPVTYEDAEIGDRLTLED